MMSSAHALAPSVPFALPATPHVLRSRQAPTARDPRRLVAGVRAQDQRALQELYARDGAMTFGFLLRLLRDRATAEDVQQEVWLDVWRRGPTYDPSRGTLLAWVMQIARSRGIDQLRRRVPEPRDPAGAVALADQEDPSASVDAAISDWSVAALLSQLPEDEGDLLRMRFADGLSQTEIAERTGVALGTVKMRMAQGLRRLRTMMEAEGVPA